ncbi:hypothetical protein SAY86_006229 [Trapa natans]|uniref:Ethylene-responsive nuclear protein n=1 Tax=Trapa natans TaxID=22666 RepID=A0AAN7LCW0_TRANT|nr:hypothetical protein SAY86_006229 [Trapa natans]
MTFPWKKKSRTDRISRLVADLQSPPKHGVSLVVETGFPTSLVDLFVKNRDCLKKPSKKSKQKHKFQALEAGSSPAAEDHGNPPAPAEAGDRNLEQSVDDAAAITESSLRDAEARVAESQAGCVVDASLVIGGIPRGEGVNAPRANRISLAVLEVFVMVVLAILTKGLVVGITMSALVLLLLEYMGVVIPSFVRDRGSRSHRDVRNSRCKRAAFIFDGTEECYFTEEEEKEEEVVGDGDSESDAPLVPTEGFDSDGKIKVSEPTAVADLNEECLGRIVDIEETSTVQDNEHESAKKRPKMLKRIAVSMKMRNQKGREERV